MIFNLNNYLLHTDGGSIPNSEPEEKHIGPLQEVTAISNPTQDKLAPKLENQTHNTVARAVNYISSNSKG